MRAGNSGMFLHLERQAVIPARPGRVLQARWKDRWFMSTTEIPRTEWPDFFLEFSREHEGRLVVVEVFDLEIGAQMEAHEVTFEEISADFRAGGNERIVLMLGKTPETHLTHIIAAPDHVRIERTEDGLHEALQIESGDATTLLRFAPRTLPQVAPAAMLEVKH